MEPIMLGDALLSHELCKGRPLSKRGGLGRKVDEETCQAKCLQSSACMFAVWKQSKRQKSQGGCSEFAVCNKVRTHKKRNFKVWAKTDAKDSFFSRSEHEA